MKKLYIILIAGIIATVSSCTYTFPEDEAPTAGSADFTKVVAVGNSLTAGFINGALYDAGQAASFVNIVAQQIKLNGGGDFNQPDINAVDGDFGPSGGAFGRLRLVNPASPAPAPIVPGQAITPYAGDKTALNNFGVPGMRIVDFNTPGYGSALGNPYFNRFATSDATTVQADVTAANGTFFTFWLGNNDVLGYALGGATNPATLTSVNDFESAFSDAIDAMTANGAKGIIANIPSINDIPHFTTVPWNAIEFDESDPVGAGTIAALNAGYAAYNGGLDAMVGMDFLSQDEADDRYIVFADGANGAVILDNSLTDLTIYNPALVSMRMASSTDLLTLSAGALLPTGVGVSSPLGEQYTLIEADQEMIATRVADFNAVIKSIVDAKSGTTLLDINSVFADIAQNGATINGAGMDASILPPFGAFSLDGVHPNERGAAYIASLFIDKINEAFGANIPNVNPNNWAGNALPVPL